MVKVFGKGSREGLVPVTPSTLPRMRRLGRHLNPEQHLFRTLKRDRTGLDRPLSYSGPQHYGHLTSGDVYNALIKALRPEGE